MKDKKDVILLISMLLGGLSLLGVLIGMAAHLSDTLIRICGMVMLASMLVIAYRISKHLKSKK